MKTELIRRTGEILTKELEREIKAAGKAGEIIIAHDLLGRPLTVDITPIPVIKKPIEPRNSI